MAVVLDLADIQGNILRAYGFQGFPKGRFIMLHVDDPVKGRRFINALLPQITTALRWQSRSVRVPDGVVPVPRPEVAINIAFSWYGLVALELPTRTMGSMPDEFIDGMMARAPMLGDDFDGRKPSEKWDDVWTAAKTVRLSDPNTVHVLITLNAQMRPDGNPVEALETTTQAIEDLCTSIGGVRVLPGHNRPGHPTARYQELTLLTRRNDVGVVEPLPTEHFGFRDGIGDPVFDGQYETQDTNEAGWKPVQGNGAFDGAGNWRPLATGEFLLGYPDEAQEIAGVAMPLDFSRNGTFMAYRKLYQDVPRFEAFLEETAPRFGAVFGISDPADALETLRAKMGGRWSDGVPLSLAPTAEDWRKFNDSYRGRPLELQRALANFTFHDDPQGIKCPIAAHMRRVNTRDTLAPSGTEGSVLNNRRRIIRRGLPYGDTSAAAAEAGEQGVVMLGLCSSLFRQFEFVQQQWINYGLDANVGNDTCPIVGNHADGTNGPKAKFVIASDPSTGRLPFIMEGIPQFVETRGGEYFFVPSMTALRMIGMGVVDPT